MLLVFLAPPFSSARSFTLPCRPCVSPAPTFLSFTTRSVFLFLFDFLFFTLRLRGNLSAGAIPVADGLIESRTSPQTQKGFHGPTSLRCRIILRDIPCCLSRHLISTQFFILDGICSSRLIYVSIYIYIDVFKYRYIANTFYVFRVT